MRLSSNAFADGAAIPHRFTCDGEDLSPPLKWNDVPAGTRSFVLRCDDPDAPAGVWHHWAVYDIAADQVELSEGAAQDTAQRFKQAINDFQRRGYGGPCPPRSRTSSLSLSIVGALGRSPLPRQQAILPRGRARGP